MINNYSDNVFINCPFDNNYSLNLQAIVFSVYRCGFYPLSALSEDNGLVNRLSKIEELIEKSQYGIHDISRVELTAEGFPRFNMSFELGLFFGATRYGNKLQKTKNALIFEKVKFTYQSYLSDLSGVDTKAHNNDTSIIIQNICNWLKTSSKRATIPGYLKVIGEFRNLQAKLPQVLKGLNLNSDKLTFSDLCLIIEEYLKASLKIK